MSGVRTKCACVLRGLPEAGLTTSSKTVTRSSKGLVRMCVLQALSSATQNWLTAVGSSTWTKPPLEALRDAAFPREPKLHRSAFAESWGGAFAPSCQPVESCRQVHGIQLLQVVHANGKDLADILLILAAETGDPQRLQASPSYCGTQASRSGKWRLPRSVGSSDGEMAAPRHGGKPSASTSGLGVGEWALGLGEVSGFRFLQFNSSESLRVGGSSDWLGR